MKQSILLIILVLSLSGCSNKETNEIKYSSNNDLTIHHSNDKGFLDFEENFHSFKEVKKAQKNYLKQIKNQEFIEAMNTEEWLLKYFDRNGLTTDEGNVLRTNHNALFLLSKVDELLLRTQEEKQPYYEVEILPMLKEIEDMDIETKEIKKQLQLYEKKTDKIFNSLSEELGEKRYSEQGTKNMNDVLESE